MDYQLPDETTLAKYLCMLQRVFVLARFRAYETDPQLARLFDAVENVPDLLMRWPDMKEDWVIGTLEHLEGQLAAALALTAHELELDSAVQLQ